MQGSAFNVGLPPQQPTQIGPTIGAAQGYNQNTANLSGTGYTTAPMAQQTAFQQYSNPFQHEYLQGAQNAATMGRQAAGNQFGLGNFLTNYGVQGTLPYAQALFQSGFDPQKDLYQRTLQQVQDQSRVAGAAAGVGTSPYGVGLEDYNTRQFNIDWENQQLQRQIAGAGGAEGVINTGAGLAGQGAGLQAGAAPLWMQAATMPYAAFQNVGSGQFGALSNFLNLTGQGQTQQNVPFQNMIALLSGQNQANQVANQQAAEALQQSNLGWQQMASLGSGLGSLAGGAKSFFPGLFPAARG